MKDKTPKISAVSKKPKKEVCKRGYKFCKLETCKKMIHIHTKICPECGHVNAMKKQTNKEKGNILELLESELPKNKKKMVTKATLKNIKSYLEDTMFKDMKYMESGKQNSLVLGKRKLVMGKDEVEILPKKQLKIEEKYGNFLMKIEDQEVAKIPTNTINIPLVVKKGVNIQTVDLGTSINDLKQVSFEFENRVFLAIFVAKNDLEKLKPRVPGCHSTYNAGQTQKLFGIEKIAPAFQRYHGNGILTIFLLEKSKKTGNLEMFNRTTIPLDGDCMKVEVLNKALDKEEQTIQLGIIESSGNLKILKIEPQKIINSTAKFELDELETFILQKEDEIISSMCFINQSKFLVGTQKGTIFYCKIFKKKIKIINSWNRLENFYITKICVLPGQESDSNSTMFAFSTADGYIKIFQTSQNFSIYEFQSTSVI